MSLIVTLEQQTGDQSCKTLVVKDTTLDNASNKYGSPNYVVSDVQQLVVEIIVPNNNLYSDPYILTGTDAEDIMNQVSNLTIDSTVIDQSLTVQSALVDGAYYLRYTPFFTAANTLSVTNNSTSATASSTLAVAPYAGVNFAFIDGEYYGLTASGTSVTLDKPYTGSTNAAIAWEAGFASRLVLKQMCNGERCVTKKIAQLYNENCQCKQLAKQEAFQKKQDLYGAQILFDKQDFTQFQLIMNQITNYCNGTEGCQCH